MTPRLTDGHLELLGAHVHLEERVGEHVAEAAAVEVAVGSAVVDVVVDVGKLQAAVLQQLVVIKLLVAHVDLLGPRQKVVHRVFCWVFWGYRASTGLISPNSQIENH